MLSLVEMLQAKFNYQTFKPGQEATITSVLEGRRTLAVLPTGAGKSLCYQLPSYYLSGTTVIVSPLVSLMEDQVQQLKLAGEKQVIAINSQLSFSEKEWALAHLPAYRFVFFSPEMILQPGVRQALKKIELSLLVVDEAHCISQWGIDFRPEYEQLHQVIAEHNYPTTLALTATATAAVVADIEAKLFASQSVNLIRQSVNRPNIAYAVQQLTNKLEYLQTFLATQKGAGIIYFSSKKMAEEATLFLARETQQRVAYYHGDLSHQERSLIQQQFLQDQLDVLCATSAFGMGINKKNIRFVIHYHLPASIEAYTQEAGRAGRDGEQSLAILLYEKGDEYIHYFLQQELIQSESELGALKNLDEQQLKAARPSLSELQLKWLDGYLTGRYSLEALEQSLKQKQQEKVTQLHQVLDYVQESTCRRAFLLNYFGETISQDNGQYCCDNCGLHAIILNSVKKEASETLSLSKNWAESLKNLFIK